MRKGSNYFRSATANQLKRGEILTLGDVFSSFRSPSEPGNYLSTEMDETTLVETFHTASFDNVAVTDYPVDKLYVAVETATIRTVMARHGVSPAYFAGLTLYPAMYASWEEAASIAAEGFAEPDDCTVFEIPFEDINPERLAVKLNEDGSFRYFVATSKIMGHQFTESVAHGSRADLKPGL